MTFTMIYNLLQESLSTKRLKSKTMCCTWIMKLQIVRKFNYSFTTIHVKEKQTNCMFKDKFRICMYEGWNFLMHTHFVYGDVCQLMSTYKTWLVSSKTKLWNKCLFHPKLFNKIKYLSLELNIISRLTIIFNDWNQSTLMK